MLAMVPYHDEPFALWHQFKLKGRMNEERLASLLTSIRDLESVSGFQHH
jgi:hypothetical protein